VTILTLNFLSQLTIKTFVTLALFPSLTLTVRLAQDLKIRNMAQRTIEQWQDVLITISLGPLAFLS
jgi:hypothetical protein